MRDRGFTRNRDVQRRGRAWDALLQWQRGPPRVRV